MSTILVTAFQPFGLVRGHVPGLRGNRSQALLETLQPTDSATASITRELLPVSPACQEVLAKRLAENPSGVLLMGEDLLAGLRLETRARDPRMQFGIVALPGADWRRSRFAEGIAARMQCAGVSARSAIGTYYCNRVYWQALEWAERAGGPPVAFLHVGPLASVHWQAAQVSDVLAQMRSATSVADA